MKLYVQCSECKRKTYIEVVTVRDRIQFTQIVKKKKVGFICSDCGSSEIISVNDVYAEGSGSTIGVVVLVLGFFSAIFIGAIGIFIGCLAAVVFNAVGESVEATQVRKFNTSVVM